MAPNNMLAIEQIFIGFPRMTLILKRVLHYFLQRKSNSYCESLSMLKVERWVENGKLFKSNRCYVK